MSQRTFARREVLKQMLAWSAVALSGNLLSACGGSTPEPPAPCEPGADDPAIGWGPSVLAPVFYGYADYNASVGSPTNLRVYYPSLDGSPQCAPFLTGPGRFPLVLFLHGQCRATEFHYTKWARLPAGLARAGYVVAIPDLSGLGSPWELTSATYGLINDVLYWMRSTWSHRQYLMPAPTLGIIGHSYGALFGGQLALTLPASAFVSVGGVWSEWPGSPPRPINSLTIPKLVVMGTGIGAFAESLNFNNVPSPKHRLLFPDGGHWDYVPPSVTRCDEADSASFDGPCELADDLVADFAALFLSKYMPPESSGISASTISVNLAPPTVSLTPEQMFFAGGHLHSLTAVASDAACTGVELEWASPEGSGSRTLS